MLQRTATLSFLVLAAGAFSQILLSPIRRAPDSPEPFPLLAPATYSLCWDIDMSPYAGGEDLLFATRVLEKGETYLLSKSPMIYSKSMYARTWRLSELFLFWLPLNFITMVVQHEVFGHGYRIRDIDHGRIRVKSYHFTAPPPYGPGNAFTKFEAFDTLTTTDLTSVAMAGIESTAILAQLTKLKWLESNRVDPRQTLLYLLAQYNLNLYAPPAEIEDEEIEGHDLVIYVRSLNYTYPESFLTVSRLRNLSWINLADPFTYYAAFAWFHYLSSGKETKIPMIPVWDYGYLFGARLGLSPFGQEYFFENYFLKGNNPLYFYLKAGWHAQNDYEGLGFFAPRLWILNKWSIGLRFDAWRQPKLLLNQGRLSIASIDLKVKPNPQNPLYSPSQQHETRFGASGSAIASYRAGSALGFEAEIGYKSRGFLPGYSLRASPTVRLSYIAYF